MPRPAATRRGSTAAPICPRMSTAAYSWRPTRTAGGTCAASSGPNSAGVRVSHRRVLRLEQPPAFGDQDHQQGGDRDAAEAGGQRCHGAVIGLTDKRAEDAAEKGLHEA